METLASHGLHSFRGVCQARLSVRAVWAGIRFLKDRHSRRKLRWEPKMSQPCPSHQSPVSEACLFSELRATPVNVPPASLIGEQNKVIRGEQVAYELRKGFGLGTPLICKSNQDARSFTERLPYQQRAKQTLRADMSFLGVLVG